MSWRSGHLDLVTLNITFPQWLTLRQKGRMDGYVILVFVTIGTTVQRNPNAYTD